MKSRERTPDMTAWESALAGIAAGSVGVAASEIIAGMTGGSSLVIALGALAIGLQPPGAKDVAVAWFGTNDKLALNLVVTAVALAIAGAAGRIARRRFAIAALGLVAVGMVAALASLRLPLASAPLIVLQVAIADVAAIVALRLLLGLPLWRSRPDAWSGLTAPETGDGAETPEWPRRRFLIATAGTLAGASLGGVIGRGLVDGAAETGVATVSRLPAALVPVAMLSADETLSVPGITPLVVGNDAFYRIDTALRVPTVDVSRWTLQVTGMVDHPLTLRYDELLAMPLYEQYVTISCVSNQVGGHLVGNALWTGVRLKDVLEMAGVQPGADQVVGRSYQEFWAGFPTAWALAPGREPLIAVGMNRVPLPPSHGFPARLIVPGLYGYVSATKWLTEIALTTRDAVDGYWVPLGWAKDGPILTQSRIDVPAYGSRVTAGRVQVAGVAWAPDRGIAAVEVRVDDGPWGPARITTAISAATWVQWAFDWTATPGEHALEVRATDATGDVQTDEISAPAPSGARGHHRVTVIVG